MPEENKNELTEKILSCQDNSSKFLVNCGVLEVFLSSVYEFCISKKTTEEEQLSQLIDNP
jgi:hypothetical protein